MTFSKYELMSFAVVTGLMLVAVWALRLETNFFASANPSTQQAASGLVVVDDEIDREGALQAAVSNSVNRRGQVQSLIVDEVLRGTGEPVAAGDTVTVHYVGRLANGQEFDNSRNRGVPFTFTVGQGRVIAGWEEGIVGMREGGTRILVIPPDKGYGPNGFGPIPGNATLIFAIELLEIN